jgi:hypothetical protein
VATKNDPKNREKAARKKLVGACGHEVVPVRVRRIKGATLMLRWCEICKACEYSEKGAAHV